MPRFTEPLQWWLKWSDPHGPLRIIIRADIGIEVQDSAGEWLPLDCMVDTGASFPTMSTAQAEAMGLSIPDSLSLVDFQTADGMTSAIVRDGELNVRFPRLRERVFSLKWLFRDDIDFKVQPLLGLHNTVDLLTLIFDGTSRPDGFMGAMEFIARDG